MARDLRLSRDFWLHEFTGWERATPEQVDRLQETVARVLQPIRSALGQPVRPTSWLVWSDGTPRDGAHAHGAVDFVVERGLTRDAFAWATEYLVPGGYIGRLIYEPARTAAEGQPQGEHIHLAPRETMVEYNRDPSIQVLEERAEGQYVMARVATAAGLGVGALALAALFFFPCAAGPGSDIVGEYAMT